MADLATLGFAVDSSPLARAKTEMQGMVPAARDAQTATDGLVNAVNKVKPAAVGLSKELVGAQNAAKGMSFEAKNLSFQLVDVAQGLLMGQSPFMIFAQQAGQIGQIVGTSPQGLSGLFKELGRSVAAIVTPMRLLTVGIVGVGAAAVATVNSVAKSAMALDDLSRAAGTTNAQMRALESAAAFKGINTDEFTKGMSQFADSVYNAQHGMGELATVFRANNTSAKSFNDYMEKAADLIAHAGSDQQRLQLLQQMGLPATMQWVRFLSQGADGIRAAIAQTTKFDEAANDKLIENARKFDEVWATAWKNFSTNGQSAIVTAIDWIGRLNSSVGNLAARIGNNSFWQNFIPSNVKPEDYGLQSVSVANTRVSSGFGAMQDNPVNSSLQRALQDRAAAMRGDSTKNKDQIQHEIQLEQQRISLLGQTATVSDAVRVVELQVAQARLAGVKITQNQVDTLKQLARENALGVTQIKAQTDALNAQAAAVGMSVGQATAYIVEQNRLNEAIRNHQALTQADKDAIHAAAQAQGEAAQAAAQAAAQDQANFDLQTAGLSGVELQIAQIQKQLHGNDWQQFMNDGLAATTRLADSMKQLADAERTMFTDFLSGMRQGKTAMESLTAAAGSFVSKMADIGANKLFDAFKSGDIMKAFSAPASQGIVEGFEAIQARAAAAKANPANSFNFNGMSGGNAAIGGVMAAGAGLGIYGQAQQAGAAGGSMVSSGASSALTGAMAGLAIGGPIGAAIGGIGGAIAGLFGFSSGQSQAAKQAKADWANAKSAAEAFGNQLAGGGGQGSLTGAISQAKSQLDQYITVAQKAGDKDAVAKLQGQYDEFINRMSADFVRSFGGVMDALNSGLGPNSPFATGAANVKDIGDQLKGLIEDAKLAFSGSPVDYLDKDGAVANAKAQADAVAQATAAAQKYALSLLGQAPVLTDTQSAIQHLNGTAAQLQSTLVDLGMSSQDAAAAIQTGVLASMKQLADTFTNGIQREINTATGQDYKNSLADLVAKFQSNLADAAALGLGPDLVNKWFKVSAQKIVNDAGLAGSAIADLTKQFPDLAGVVTASGTALQALTQDLTDAYNSAASAVSDRRQDLVTAYQSEAKSIQDNIDKMKSFTAQWKQFQASLNVGQMSPYSPQQQYLDAQAQARQDFSLALGGDQDAMSRIQDDLSTYLDQSKSYNASSEQYFKDFQDAQDMLDKLQASGNTQVNVAQQQLDVLNAQVSGLIDINTSVQSVTSAVNALQAAIVAQKIAAANLQPAAAASGDVDALYQSVLGRAPDAQGKLYWQQQIASGMTGQDLLRSFVGGAIAAGQRNQVDPTLLARYGLQNGGIVGAFAGGGLIGNGIMGVDSVLARFAGGGNVMLAGGEYVMPTAQTRANLPMLEAMRSGRPGNDNGAVVSEIKALRTAVERLGSIIGLSDQETRNLINEGNAATKDSVSLLRKAVNKVAA